MQKKKMLVGLPPVVDRKTRILVLGSFPGAKSLKVKQYYANERNLFWQIVSAVLGMPMPGDYKNRIKILKRNGIGLWDVVALCRRSGSADGRIVSPVINDIPVLLRKHRKIRAVFLNGKTAEKFFKRQFGDSVVNISVNGLPSTSPANAGQPRAFKIAKWKKITSKIKSGSQRNSNEKL